MADSTVSTSTDTVVITTLLVRLTQNRWSGRDITATRLSTVGGIGRDIGLLAMSGPFLITLASTTYSGTKNNAPTTIATTGRSHGKAERFTGQPPGAATVSGSRSRRSR